MTEPSGKTPSLFIGHGSPMIAIQENSFTESLLHTGLRLPQPDAILVISAHWLTKGIFVSDAKNPETIYDFQGFDPELRRIVYPCPGAPDFAESVCDALFDFGVKKTERGLDHGAWQILKYLFPDANVPVFQMSMDYSLPLIRHFNLAKKLRPLREKGLMIIGSGNVVHNLMSLNWSEQDAPPYEWAKTFQAYVKEKLVSRDFESLVHYGRAGESAAFAQPSDDHFLPLLYTIAQIEEKDEIEIISEEFHYAGIGMLSFIVRNR